MANTKEMRNLVRLAVKAGCTAKRRTNGHTRLTAPNGEFLDISFSPGTQKGVQIQKVNVIRFLAINTEKGIYS